VSILGLNQKLAFKKVSAGLRITMPVLEDNLVHQPCLVLKISQ